MERIKDSSVMKQKKAVWGVSGRRCGVARGLPSTGQLQLMVGKGHCSHTLFGVICAVRGRMWRLCVCVEGDCICRGIMCSLSFLRYWRSRSLCALFCICKSMQFFFFATVLGFDQTENTGEKRGITARAFRASVFSSAPIVFQSQYCIFPTSSSQFFLLWQPLSWIILVPVLFFLEHPSKRRCTLDEKYLIFIPHLPSQASMLVVSFAPL